MKKSRWRAHEKLDDYISFLVDSPVDTAATDGADEWILLIDQAATWAANKERESLAAIANEEPRT